MIIYKRFKNKKKILLMKYKLSVKKLKIGKSNLTKAKMKSSLCKMI